MSDMFEVARMTSDELAAAISNQPVAVMIPAGAVEPHGPHLPLDTDLVISRAAAARALPALAAAGVRGLLAPDVAYGVTDCASEFAGAAGVTGAALESYLADVVGSWLANGVAHVCVISNHLEPAHEETIRRVVSHVPGRASAATPLARRWARTLSDEFRRGACHAGEYETSIVMAVRPDAVRAVAATLPDVDVSLSDALRSGKRRFLEMGLDHAYAGAPARATAAHGEEMLARLADMIASEILSAMGRVPGAR